MARYLELSPPVLPSCSRRIDAAKARPHTRSTVPAPRDPIPDKSASPAHSIRKRLASRRDRQRASAGRHLGRLQSIFGRRHVTDLPGAIHLIAQAPVFYIVRIVQCRVRRSSLHCVPLSTLQYSTSAAACSAVPVPRFRPMSGSVPNRFAPSHELVGAELIGIHRVPRFVETARTILLGPTPSSQL